MTYKNKPLKIPQKILAEFMKPKRIKFKVDSFEQLAVEDMMRDIESMAIKLNRNLTEYFIRWITEKLELKEQIKINIMGQTRSGKSLVGIRVLMMINKYYKFKFNPQTQITANQKEYRLNIQKAEFGMPFQVDENAFTNVGLGAITEAHQLKDIQNITAKKNIHTIFITPELFLPTGAGLGLQSYGKDIDNYLSRFLVYKLQGGMQTLLGFCVFNVGQNYVDEGCLIFKQIGGCNNVNKVSALKINKSLLKYSFCIPSKYKTEPALTSLEKSNKKSKEYRCPFYSVCLNGMCGYEKKKDEWINKQLTGGHNERDLDRYLTAYKIFKKVSFITEEGNIGLKSKNSKELKLKVKMLVPSLTSTKYTGVEYDEIVQLIISMVDKEFLNEVLNILKTNNLLTEK